MFHKEEAVMTYNCKNLLKYKYKYILRTQIKMSTLEF